MVGTPYQVGGTRSLPGICFLQQSGCAGSTAGCKRPTKIIGRNPQLGLSNCEITQGPRSPPQCLVKRERVPLRLDLRHSLRLLKTKRKNLTLNLLHRDFLFLTRCRASEGFLGEQKSHVPPQHMHLPRWSHFCCWQWPHTNWPSRKSALH